MPIYEYQCGDCSFSFEVKRRFDESEGEASCPQCHGQAHRIFSPVPVLFRGSGFYSTDKGEKSENQFDEDFGDWDDDLDDL